MILDGREIAKEIEKEVAHAIHKHKGRKPGLAFILVGDNPASRVYVSKKKKKCAEVGILSFDRELKEDISEEKLIQEIQALNGDERVDGILLQLPLPSHIDVNFVISTIDPNKDVDGLHPLNMGKLLLGESGGFSPCTPLGIMTLLSKTKIATEGKHAVVVGRSNLVGKPLAALLVQKSRHANATVTIAHSYTKHLAEICRSADILIAAIGKEKLITREMVKEGAVVIDVGINRGLDGAKQPIIVGDVDFEQVAPKCSYITPVPGGVGPMTIAMLLSNTLTSYQRKQL